MNRERRTRDITRRAELVQELELRQSDLNEARERLREIEERRNQHDANVEVLE